MFYLTASISAHTFLNFYFYPRFIRWLGCARHHVISYTFQFIKALSENAGKLRFDHLEKQFSVALYWKLFHNFEVTLNRFYKSSLCSCDYTAWQKKIWNTQLMSIIIFYVFLAAEYEFFSYTPRLDCTGSIKFCISIVNWKENWAKVNYHHILDIFQCNFR